MRRPVVWASAALDDLLAIGHYIATHNPAAASKMMQRLRATASNLGEMPTGRPGRVTGTYEKLTPGLPYILAYEIASLPHDDGECVAILHVIHGARDWPNERWPAP